MKKVKRALVVPEDVFDLFSYEMGYNKNNITWTKVSKFNKDFELNLTQDQLLHLHNFRFKND
jgi:hypothetical protein